MLTNNKKSNKKATGQNRTIRVKKAFITFIVLAILLLFLLSYMKIKERKKTIMKDAFTGEATVTAKTVTFYQTNHSIVAWTLSAETADMFDVEKKAILYGIKGSFKTKNSLEISFEGEMATINTSTKDFTIDNGTDLIRININNGFSLKSERFSWNNSERKLSSDTPVLLTGGGLNVSGDRFHIDVASGKILFNENVHAIFKN